jgi:hypothetical protein
MYLKDWPTEEARLDLREVTLYGWESHQSRRKIRRYVKALEAGAVFPAVAVELVPEAGYFLVPRITNDMDRVDGGHHRALAHFIADIPLPARVQEIASVPTGIFVPIDGLV